MTIAIGLLCADGVVIAADSQETVSGYWKRRQGKIAGITVAQKLSIGVAGAGRAGYVDALSEQLLNSIAPKDATLAIAEGIFRQELLAFHRDHVLPYQSDPPETPLIIAMQQGKYAASLYVTDRSTMTETSFAPVAVGIGAGHALSVLNRVLDRMPILPSEEMTVTQAVGLAAYAVHHTNHHVADCGDVTTILTIRNGKLDFVDQDDIAKMNAVFTVLLDDIEPSIVGSIVGIQASISGFPPAPRLDRRVKVAAKAIASAAKPKRKVSLGEKRGKDIPPGKD